MKAAPVDLTDGSLAADRFRIGTPKPATPEALAKVVTRLVAHHEWVGPVGKGTLEPFAYDKPVMERLWNLSEKETGFDWKL